MVIGPGPNWPGFWGRLFFGWGLDSMLVHGVPSESRDTCDLQDLDIQGWSNTEAIGWITISSVTAAAT